MVELVDQIDRIFFQRLVIDAGIGNIKVESRRHNIEYRDDAKGHFTDGVDPGINQRKIESKQLLGNFRANQCAADDNAQRQQSISSHVQPVRQVFGQDVIFGRRVGGRAETDHGIGDKRMSTEEHHAATDNFYGVADEHDPALGHRVSESAYKGGQHHIRNGEESLE